MRNIKSFTAREQQKLKKLIFDKTGYHIRGNALLTQIFTRSSYSAERGGENHEVLEFIGDQVLAFYLVKAVTARCGSRNSENEFASRIREDRFTAIKHELVSNETLAGIADEWGIAKYMIVGRKDFENGIDRQMKPKADLIEAILGAIALESKWDPAVLETAVTRILPVDAHLSQMLQQARRPLQFKREKAVSTLKEMADRRECPRPVYAFQPPQVMGYEEDGDPVWGCTCTVDGAAGPITGQGSGNTKKQAKMEAAASVLETLAKKYAEIC